VPLSGTVFALEQLKDAREQLKDASSGIVAPSACGTNLRPFCWWAKGDGNHVDKVDMRRGDAHGVGAAGRGR
jgi:hypothetical protein